MEALPLPTVPTDVLARAARIRLACFDVDGTLTDGRLWMDRHGEEIKAFHIHDGMGLRLLEDNGVRVAMITARDSAVAAARGRDLKLSEVHVAIRDKRMLIEQLALKYGIGLDQVAMMGDDLVDLPALRVAGLAVVPANAHLWVSAGAHWQTSRAGGDGAARELADLILQAQGRVAAVLAGFGA